MKISMGAFALVAGVTFSGAAAADTTPAATPPADTGSVAAEKVSPIKGFLPGAYASLELRHDSLRAMNPDSTIHNDKVGMFIIPKIGTTLFNDKVDTSFTYKFEKVAATDTLIKYDAYNETQWNVIDGKINDKSPYSAGPYAFTDLLTQGGESWNYANVGLYGEVNYEFPIASGAISTLAYLNPTVQLLNNQGANTYNRVPVTDRTDKGADKLTQYGLSNTGSADSPTYTGVQKDDSYSNAFGFGAKYKPAAVPGLSVGLGVDFVEVWNPYYVENNVNGVPTQQMDHYAVQAWSMNRFVVGYKFNDKVSLTEQFREFNNGFEQRSITTKDPDQTGNVGTFRWENRLALTATLL